jgi:hypothetical protein
MIGPRLTPDELLIARRNHRRTGLPVGRPKGNRTSICFSVSLQDEEQKIKFVRLGGSKWLREQINKAKEKTK